LTTSMTNAEAIHMMTRCKQELEDLRAEIGRLQPKADAYDNIAKVLALLPQRGVSAREDLAWVLSKRIRELTDAASAAGGPRAGVADAAKGE